MKKTLLIPLALLSTQVFSADVDLECKESGMELEYKFIQLKDPIDKWKGDAYFFWVSFDKDGNAIGYSERTLPRTAYWGATDIKIEYASQPVGTIDRETLKFKGSYPYPTKEYNCEIADNLDAKRKRWKKEADDVEKARIEAKKAKNVI